MTAPVARLPAAMLSVLVEGTGSLGASPVDLLPLISDTGWREAFGMRNAHGSPFDSGYGLR